MATNKRTYPNSNFAWYNDEDRIAIVCEDTSQTGSETISEKYDTFQGTGNLSGTISSFADYNGTVAGTTKATCSASHGLATGDRVTITSSPDGDLDGNYSITRIDDDEFYFSKSHVAESSGTFTSLFIDNGLRITYAAKYGTIDAQSEDLKTDAGLDSGLHPAVLCYVKGRMFEDAGDLQKAQYFRGMYDKMMRQYPLRKSGVRTLSVPKM
jgi:hypothetical protein